ncbi:hypothetical protein Ait01nite_091740 [Actinoplanes italicus]|uniref:Resolvase-like protein n=1 Tax=Actinoplanes italicus TaxID=113567 RepID=A0A2T0JT14_9ACTN|nr:recombinase family protein [Actinoplanes italicus]PRX10573.1 resolvase-like protein [Actinoplanes italicus]GIE36129.1 hypothetical protein Ait01nite_091740 [Actinoplanes italicus]
MLTNILAERYNSIVATAHDTSGLARWLQDQPSPRRRGLKTPPPAQSRLRFAFYGRVSTANHQDPVASHQWQREAATQAVGTAGAIVCDYFDIGCSRSLPWHDRPQASRLLDAIRNPKREFDAIIVGESDRAFSGNQLQQLLPTLTHSNITLWLPELGGPLYPGNPTHRALIALLGNDARREVLRARHRTLTAMRALARDGGRFLGGRPPYGYHLADAGPHPNPAHARWGRRLQRLEPDPATAPHVRWIFTQRLAGNSPATIAAMLTHRGVACPSAADPGRNPHRNGKSWATRAVDGILANPRYTGRQVWDRQKILHHETRPGGGDTGGTTTRRASTKDQWVISGVLAHPALIDEATFVAAQRISSLAVPADGQERHYLITGLIICDVCERRAEPLWVHGKAAYRCRHGYRTARPANSPLPFYAREDALLAAAASELERVTGDTQTLWDRVALSGFLRARQVTLRCSRDIVALVGPLPENVQLVIPDVIGVSSADLAGVTGDAGGNPIGFGRFPLPKIGRPTKRRPRRITARSVTKRNP